MEDEQRPVAPASRIQDLRERVELGQKLFTLLRDAALLTLFVVLVGTLIYSPSTIFEPLRDAGVEKVGLVGVATVDLRKAHQEGVTALREVEQSEQAAVQALHNLKQVTADNPTLAREVAPIAESIRLWIGSLGLAGDQLDSSVASQRTVLQQADVPLQPVEGWISLRPTRLLGPRRIGTRAVVGDRPLRVRNGPDPNAPVVAVLPTGTVVEIKELGSPPRARVTQVQE